MNRFCGPFGKAAGGSWAAGESRFEAVGQIRPGDLRVSVQLDFVDAKKFVVEPG
jgi:hypothetical protein